MLIAIGSSLGGGNGFLKRSEGGKRFLIYCGCFHYTAKPVIITVLPPTHQGLLRVQDIDFTLRHRYTHTNASYTTPTQKYTHTGQTDTQLWKRLIFLLHTSKIVKILLTYPQLSTRIYTGSLRVRGNKGDRGAQLTTQG